MTDNPQDNSEERRRRRSGRTGPLGDDSQETRRLPTGEGLPRSAGNVPGEEETRRVETERMSRPREEDKETRVIRTPDAARRRDATQRDATRRQDARPYPQGYFEAAEEREERLRDIHGGFDWLASFLGFVFAAVAGAVLFGVAGAVLVPLGISVQIGGRLTSAAITALVVLAVLIFLTFFFGGYVAGRLARFDGGRNGALSVLWSIFVALVFFVVGTFLPGSVGSAVRNFYQGSLLPTLGNLQQLGAVAIVVVAAALVVAFLGGVAGGRLGSRYHALIDRTT